MRKKNFFVCRENIVYYKQEKSKGNLILEEPRRAKSTERNPAKGKILMFER